jgi:hypothetical protein
MNIQLTLQIFSVDDKDENSCLGMIIVEIYNHFGEMSVTRWGPLSSCPGQDEKANLEENSTSSAESTFEMMEMDDLSIDQDSESNDSDASKTQSMIEGQNEGERNTTLDDDFIDVEGLDSHDLKDIPSVDKDVDFSYEPDEDENEEEDNS